MKQFVLLPDKLLWEYRVYLISFMLRIYDWLFGQNTFFRVRFSSKSLNGIWTKTDNEGGHDHDNTSNVGRANLAQNVEAALMSVCVCVGTARLRSPRGHWSLHHIVCAPRCGPVNSLPWPHDEPWTPIRDILQTRITNTKPEMRIKRVGKHN